MHFAPSPCSARSSSSTRSLRVSRVTRGLPAADGCEADVYSVHASRRVASDYPDEEHSAGKVVSARSSRAERHICVPVAVPVANKSKNAAAVAHKGHDVISVCGACVEATDGHPAVVGVYVGFVPHARQRARDGYGQLQWHGLRALLAAAADCRALEVGAARDGCGEQRTVFVGGAAVRDAEITRFASVWQCVDVPWEENA